MKRKIIIQAAATPNTHPNPTAWRRKEGVCRRESVKQSVSDSDPPEWVKYLTLR